MLQQRMALIGPGLDGKLTSCQLPSPTEEDISSKGEIKVVSESNRPFTVPPPPSLAPLHFPFTNYSACVQPSFAHFPPSC